MEPPRAPSVSSPARPKNLVPVPIPRLAGRNRCVPAIRTPRRCPNAMTALCKIQPIARRATHAVIRNPAEQGSVDAALQDQVLHQPPDGIVRHRRRHRRLQPEAPPQPARHVVFAAALPRRKLPRCVDAPLARIEPQHHLAEAHLVPARSALLQPNRLHPSILHAPLAPCPVFRDSPFISSPVPCTLDPVPCYA